MASVSHGAAAALRRRENAAASRTGHGDRWIIGSWGVGLLFFKKKFGKVQMTNYWRWLFFSLAKSLTKLPKLKIWQTNFSKLLEMLNWWKDHVSKFMLYYKVRYQNSYFNCLLNFILFTFVYVYTFSSTFSKFGN